MAPAASAEDVASVEQKVHLKMYGPLDGTGYEPLYIIGDGLLDVACTGYEPVDVAPLEQTVRARRARNLLSLYRERRQPYLAHSVYDVVLQKSIPAQIRQLIPYCDS